MKIKTYLSNKYIRGTLLVLAGIFMGWLIFHRPHNEKINQGQTVTENKKTIWTCSMHPQIRMDKPGKCPICGMDLVPINNGNEDSTGFNKIQLSESAMKIAEVQTTLVGKAMPGKEIRLTGKVKPDETAISVITSRFPGRIEK